jgi:peptide/nickel transport system substrate-binding protein
VSDASPGDSLDFRFAESSTSGEVRTRAIASGLSKRDPQTGQYVLDLAETFEPAADAKSWTVRLHDAEFSDGKPVTADDVIFTIKRGLNPATAASAAGLVASVDPKQLKKLDSKTVRIGLKYPDVTLVSGFGTESWALMPTNYDPNKPIGAGPYKVESFTPGQRTVLVRNDNYWRTGLPYLDRVEMIGFADPGATRVAAFQGGQIDAIEHVPFPLVPQLQGNGAIKTSLAKSQNFHSWEMRVDIEPFKDPRVRQAMRLLVDRQQIVEQALGGPTYASVGNDVGGSHYDPFFDTSLPQRQQDIEQAKSLLKQAGQSNMQLVVPVADVANGTIESAQVIAANAQQAGITMTLNKVSDIGTYWAKHFYTDPFKFDYWNTTSVLSWASWSLLPTGSYNASHYNDPHFNALVTEARGTLDTNKRQELLTEAQKYFWGENGSVAVYGFFKDIGAYSDKFWAYCDVWARGFADLEHFYQV